MWANSISSKPAATHDLEISNSVTPPEFLIRFFTLKAAEDRLQGNIQSITRHNRVCLDALSSIKTELAHSMTNIMNLIDKYTRLVEAMNDVLVETAESGRFAAQVAPQEDVDHI